MEAKLSARRVGSMTILLTTRKWHWFGTLSIAPNGRIDAVWLDLA